MQSISSAGVVELRIHVSVSAMMSGLCRVRTGILGSEVCHNLNKSNSTAGAVQVEANLLEQISEYLQF